MAKRKLEVCPNCGKKKKDIARHKPFCGGRDSKEVDVQRGAGVASSDTPSVNKPDIVGVGVEKKSVSVQGVPTSSGVLESGRASSVEQGATASDRVELGGNVPVPQDTQVTIVNPPPSVQTEQPAPEKKTKTERTKVEPLEFEDWEGLIKKSISLGGVSVDKAVSVFKPDLAGIWVINEEEIDLHAMLLARKLRRANIDSVKAENALLAIATGVTLVPRAVITGVEIYKTVKVAKESKVVPEPQVEPVEPAVDATREEAAAQWANRK